MLRSPLDAFFANGKKYNDRIALRHKVDGSGYRTTFKVQETKM